MKDEFIDYDAIELGELIQKRESARAAKNWDLADKIRSQLQSSGVCVRDQKISPGDGIQK